MERLPGDINAELIYKLKWPDNVNLCRINRRYAQICKNPEIWKKLLIRDFPLSYQSLSKGQNYREIYNKIWTLIDSAELYLENNRLFANKKLVNLDAIRERIIAILIRTIEENAKNKNISYDDWMSMKDDILSILSALKPKYIGYYGEGKLDFVRLGEDDLGMDVDNLFYHLGYTLNREKFNRIISKDTHIPGRNEEEESEEEDS